MSESLSRLGPQFIIDAINDLDLKIDSMLRVACEGTQSTAAELFVPGMTGPVRKFGDATAPITAMPFQQFVARQASEQKKPVFFPNVQNVEEWQQHSSNPQDPAYAKFLNSYRSEMAFPLMNSRDVIAVLSLQHKSFKLSARDEITKVVRRCIAATKPELVKAIWHKPYEYIERKKEAETKFAELARQCLQGNAQFSICDLITQQAVELSRADCAALWMVHRLTNRLILVSISPPTLLNSMRAVVNDLDQGLRGQVLRTEQPVYEKNTDASETWSHCIPGVKSCCVIPLTLGAEYETVLCIDSYRHDAFDQNILQEVLNGFVAKCGDLLQSAFDAQKQRLQEPQLYGSLAGDQARADLFHQAVEITRSLVGAKSCSIFWQTGEEPPRFELVDTTGLASGSSADASYRKGEGITGWVAEHRIPLRLKNCGDRDELARWGKDLVWQGKTREFTSRMGFERPLLILPFLGPQGECVGLLRASGKEDGSEFREEDHWLLSSLGTILVEKVLKSDAKQVESPRNLSFPRYLETVSKLQPECAAILKRCLDACAADVGWIGLLKDAGTPAPLTSIGPFTDWQRRTGACDVLTESLRWGHHQVIQNVDDPEWKDLYHSRFDAPIKSAFITPLFFGNKVIGVMEIGSRGTNYFNPNLQIAINAYARYTSRQLAYYLFRKVLNQPPIPLPQEKTHGTEPDNQEMMRSKRRRFRANRRKYPADKLAGHAGHWVAWNRDGTEILASVSRPKDLPSALATRHLTIQDVSCERIPTAEELQELSLTADCD